MNPKAIDALQITHDSLPTVAATAPMENNTSGGTPLATQKAPVQSMPRSRPAPLLAAVSTLATSAVELMSFPSACQCAARRVQRARRMRLAGDHGRDACVSRGTTDGHPG